jgi:hypothetical protein
MFYIAADETSFRPSVLPEFSLSLIPPSPFNMARSNNRQRKGAVKQYKANEGVRIALMELKEDRKLSEGENAVLASYVKKIVEGRQQVKDRYYKGRGNKGHDDRISNLEDKYGLLQNAGKRSSISLLRLSLFW